MVAAHACRRALVAVGIGVTIWSTAAPAGAVTLPPVSLPPVSLPPVTTLPPLTVPEVTAPAVTVPALPDIDASVVVPGSTAGVPATTVVEAGTSAVEGSASSSPGAAGAPTPDALRPGAGVPGSGGNGVGDRGTGTRAAEDVASPPLRTVASERARQFAVPFTLVVLVLAFLTAQHRLGRHDPRLVAAPVDDDRRRFR